MNKLVGIVFFLIVLYAMLLISDEGARSVQNHYNLGRRIGLYGTISLGAGILIIAGGIDLSIGSVVGLSATILGLALTKWRFPPTMAILLVLGLGMGIGLIHGLLVTRLRVQAFVVTLCGLFIYRGLARWISEEKVVGLANDFDFWKQLLSQGRVGYLPRSFVILAILSGLAVVFLHFTVYGRYLYAIGSNERAARYSGIAIDRYKILAYVICSTLAALCGVLFLMQENSVQPSTTGSFFELYAIAGAVLGGCSLRGGEGNVAGILVGTAILMLLPNLVNMWGIPSALEYTVIGTALLCGAILDELMRRRGPALQPKP